MGTRNKMGRQSHLGMRVQQNHTPLSRRQCGCVHNRENKGSQQFAQRPAHRVSLSHREYIVPNNSWAGRLFLAVGSWMNIWVAKKINTHKYHGIGYSTRYISKYLRQM